MSVARKVASRVKRKVRILSARLPSRLVSTSVVGSRAMLAAYRELGITGRIDLVHANDSRDPFGSGADRHTLVLHVDAHDLADPTRPVDAGDCGDLTLGVVAADPALGVDAGGQLDDGGQTGPHEGTVPVAPVVPVEDAHGRTRAMDRQVLRRLACEAGLVLVALDGDGTPLDLGRRDRRLSTALRRALLARDRSCRFPGCGSRRHLHAHHVHHWADGGPTDLANLVLLCSTHHRYVHDHDWTVTPVGAGRFAFAPPHAPALPDAWQLPELGDADPADLIAAPDIDDPNALRPAHWPDQFDLNLTISVLHQELCRAMPTHALAA
jgi:hypothetical protein